MRKLLSLFLPKTTPDRVKFILFSTPVILASVVYLILYIFAIIPLNDYTILIGSIMMIPLSYCLVYLIIIVDGLLADESHFLLAAIATFAGFFCLAGLYCMLSVHAIWVYDLIQIYKVNVPTLLTIASLFICIPMAILMILGLYTVFEHFDNHAGLFTRRQLKDALDRQWELMKAQQETKARAEHITRQATKK